MQKAVKDLEPGDRVLTIDGYVATIKKAQRCYLLEGSPPPFEVIWTNDGEQRHQIVNGEDIVKLAEEDQP